MDIRRCLDRIRYSGPLRPDIATLRSLQRSFVLHLPFENLDIHNGVGISLSADRIFEKIVRRMRGGVCFERTILFYDLLSAIGFDASILSAPMVKGEVTGPEFGHMVLAVRLEDDYLVDVGNGHFLREPIRIDGTDEPAAEGYQYRIGSHADTPALLCHRQGRPWLARFTFSMVPRHVADFEQMNLFHQTATESVYRRRRKVTIATASGRVSLIDRELVIADGQGQQRRGIVSDAEYSECLRRYFKIELQQTIVPETGEAPRDSLVRFVHHS